ncbi:hypothetical protein ACFV7Q_27275 [Streptomyces sp. NPDC059851]|uniref:hypothetical protein n=1 Tax=Streptomyces sp. NPDC059851 TaxID=3346971 RepID=UPI003668346F
MLINGFEGVPLVAGEELVSRPGFWAAYLMWMCCPEEYEGPPTPEWFGADPADADVVSEALVDENNWPVIRIPFGDGHTAVVMNRPYGVGTQYVITHPDWGRHGHLARIGGDPEGPGLSWRELTHIARTPDLEAPGIHDPHARLLLLLPAMSDEEALEGPPDVTAEGPTPATDVIAGALVRVGVPAGRAVRVAELLVDHPMWEPLGWWLPDEQPFGGTLLSDDPGSPRHGTGLAQGITDEQNERLARALGTWPA